MNENIFMDENGDYRVKPCRIVVTASGQIKGAGELVTIAKQDIQTETEEVEDGVQ